MAVSPLCEVQDGAGPFLPTINGLTITAGNVVSIRLADITSVVDWFLQVTGTDETSTPPTLAGVNNLTNKVATPGTVVTFTVPAGSGRSFLIQSTVTGPGGPLTTTFSLYVVTLHGQRVGSTGEMREGSANFGWATILNPLIRSGAPVLLYNDAIQAPFSGAITVQGVIDWLKTQIGGGGGGPTPFTTSLFGEYSAAETPGFLDAPYLVQAPQTLAGVLIFRRKAGQLGSTRVDVWRNGTSIFGGNPLLMPKVDAALGDYKSDLKSPGLALVPTDRLEVVLHEVETFASGPTPQEDGPEGLLVILLFS